MKRTTVFLFTAVGLSTLALLVETVPAGANPELAPLTRPVTVQPTPHVPTAMLVQGLGPSRPGLFSLSAPVPPTGPRGPLDGLYFLGGPRTLTLERGQFKVEDVGQPFPLVQGHFHVDNDDLEFESLGQTMRCHTLVHDGELVLGVMRRTAPGSTRWVAERCDTLVPLVHPALRFGEPPRVEWDEATGRWWFDTSSRHVEAPTTRTAGDRLSPEDTGPLPEWSQRVGDAIITPWSRRVGAVGVFPDLSVDAAGSWRSSDGRTFEVRRGPRPSEPVFGRVIYWHPNLTGVSFDVNPIPEAPHALEDWPLEQFLIATGPRSAVLFSTGGEVDRPPSTCQVRLTR